MSKYEFVLVQPKSTITPLPRSGHRCVTDGVLLYVFGGFNPGTTEKLFSEIWCFNLSLQTWQELETSGESPYCVASSCLVLRRGKLIVFGGSGYPFGMHSSNKTVIFDLRDQTWEVVPQIGDTPDEGYGQSTVIGPDNCMYMFGGTKGLEYNNDLHKMDLHSYSWEYIPCRNAPSPRYRHEAVGIDGGFLVIGGYGEQGACSLDKVFIYSYDHCAWTEVNCHGFDNNEFPRPRRAHSCVRYNGDVYICGGYNETNPTEEPNVYDDVWKLDLQTFSWQKIAQVLPFPRFFHSAAITRAGCMYIFGGVQQTSKYCQARTNDVHRMWLTIPPLLEICWEILCKIIPVSAKLDTNHLAKLGIPRHLLARYTHRM